MCTPKLMFVGRTWLLLSCINELIGKVGGNFRKSTLSNECLLRTHYFQRFASKKKIHGNMTDKYIFVNSVQCSERNKSESFWLDCMCTSQDANISDYRKISIPAGRLVTAGVGSSPTPLFGITEDEWMHTSWLWYATVSMLSCSDSV